MTTPDDCTCGRIRLGVGTYREGREVAGRNWNPDCREHGLESAWYQSAEQVEKRRAASERLRDVQARARSARERAREAHRDNPR